MDTCKCAGVGAEIGEAICCLVGDGEGFAVGARDNPSIRAQDKEDLVFFMATWRALTWALGITME